MPAKPYHHGSLDEALIQAAIKAIRTSGIDSLTLRNLARDIGVSPSAVYRHFPSLDYLLARVSQHSRQALAQRMIDAREGIPQTGNAKQRSLRRFEAIGKAYISFAIEHPHLFTAAFRATDVSLDIDDDPSAWLVLNEAIDEMVATGAIPQARRTDASIIAWSGVHGLAKILTESAKPPGLNDENHIDAVIKGVVRAIS